MSLMPWDRYRALSQLGFLTEREIADTSIDGRKWVVSRLKNAMAREAKHAREGHWTYQRPRHLHLIATHKAEAETLAAMIEERAVA